MPTTNTSSIGSAGGRDYSTISAWEAATDNDLVSGDDVEIGELYDDSDFAGGVTIAGATTDATRYRELRAASGAEYDIVTASGAQITTAAASGLIVNEPYFRATAFIIAHTGISYGLYSTADISGAIFDRLTIYSVSSSTLVKAIRSTVSSTSTYTYVRNSVFINASTTNASYLCYNSGSGDCNWVYENCVGDGREHVAAAFGGSGTSDPYMFNVAAMRGTVSDFSLTSASSDYNYSEDTSAPGTHSTASNTIADDFTAVASNNYTPKDSTSELYDAGATITGHLNGDYNGVTRTAPWEIGPYDRVTALIDFGATAGGASGTGFDLEQVAEVDFGATAGGATATGFDLEVEAFTVDFGATTGPATTDGTEVDLVATVDFGATAGAATTDGTELELAATVAFAPTVGAATTDALELTVAVPGADIEIDFGATTGGATTAGTELSITIGSTIGTAGRDYVSFVTWEAATDYDLVAADVIEIGYVYDDSTFTSGVLITGATTDANHYRALRPGIGVGNYDPITDTGPKLNIGTGNGLYVYFEDYTQIVGIGAVHTQGTGQCWLYTGSAASAGGNLWDGCSAIDDVGITSGCFWAVNATGGPTNPLTVRNCLFVNKGPANSGYTVQVGIEGFVFENCVIDAGGVNDYALSSVKTTTGGLPTTNALATNCAAIGSVTADFFKVSASSDYCYSEDASAVGGNSLTSQTPASDFFDIANNNYTALDATSAFVDVGQTLSGHVNGDIQGLTRTPPWDISPYEFVLETVVEIDFTGQTGGATAGNWFVHVPYELTFAVTAGAATPYMGRLGWELTILGLPVARAAAQLTFAHAEAVQGSYARAQTVQASHAMTTASQVEYAS